MSDKAWFLCISNEALGPFTTSLVAKLLQERRITASDYAWSEGLSGWTPLSECSEFEALIPGAPTIPVPKGKAPLKMAPAPKPVKAKPIAVVESEPEPEPEVEEIQAEAEVEEEVEAPAPPPPAAKPKPKKPAAVAAPAPAPQPKPRPVETAPEPKILRVAIDATVKIVGGGSAGVFEISETGVVFEQTDGLETGADVKFKIESTAFAKALDLTGVVAGNEPFNGKPAISVEFTRVNPAHKRAIAQYISGKQKPEKSAA